MSPAPAYHQTARAEVHATSPWSSFSYVNRRLDAAVAELIARTGITAGASALDYGCADSPYRHVLPAGVRYVGADLPGNPGAEVHLSPDGTLPLPDDGVDLVLSTQVLEHVEDPARYLRECHRVLRPGGSLVLTTHGIMYYHLDPTDYWRWTCDGLERIVRDAGFEIAEMRGVVGLAPTALQLFQDATGKKVPRPLRKVYVLVMQALMALTDRFHSDTGRLQNSCVLGVRARRPT